MANNEGYGAPVQGEGKGENYDAGVDDEDVDRRKADADFDDLIIEVDESELESELTGHPVKKR
jgi:hypothetical protein